MGFVSYSQNFEDVMLWRCFSHLVNGFYIDLGAGDPTVESVTKSFYEIGWSGINIEPTASAFLKLEEERPRDTNLRIAVAEHEGVIDFWEIPSTGLSTAVKKFAERHENAGFDVQKISVRTQTLTEICKEFAGNTIHFMKIDVEGFEQEVLKSADFENFRPMVILIESTEPNSKVECQQDWEEILISNNYFFCYADGLNRFYLSNESKDLNIHFQYPPNVFDGFQISPTSPFYNPSFINANLQEKELRLLEVTAESSNSKRDLNLISYELNQLRDALTQQCDELAQQCDELTAELGIAVAERGRITQALTLERDQIAADRDAVNAKLAAVVNSRIWRFTKFYRESRLRKP
jgi:FkbM family methyltransferase